MEYASTSMINVLEQFVDEKTMQVYTVVWKNIQNQPITDGKLGYQRVVPFKVIEDPKDDTCNSDS